MTHYRYISSFVVNFPANCETGKIKEVETQLKNLRGRSNQQIKKACTQGLFKATMPQSINHSSIQTDIVRIILEHGIDPCTKLTFKGNTQTLLHTTILSPNLANNDNKDIIEQFLGAGVDPEIQDSNGKSAYDIADDFCRSTIDMFASKNIKGPTP